LKNKPKKNPREIITLPPLRKKTREVSVFLDRKRRFLPLSRDFLLEAGGENRPV